MPVIKGYRRDTGWAGWNQVYMTGNTTASALTMDMTWAGWNQVYMTGNTTASALTMDTTWAGWNQVYIGNTTGTTSSTVQITSSWITWNRVYQETGENRIEWERREAERTARLAREHEQAQARAEELLMSLLSDEQAGELQEHGYFRVRGSESGRMYRIRRGIAGNIDRLTEDSETRRDMTYCAHPSGLPEADVNLAQLLLIATDEPEFLKIANATAITADQEVIPINRRRQRIEQQSAA